MIEEGMPRDAGTDSVRTEDVEDRIPMSPDEYLAHLERLVSEVRDQDALDFATRFQPTVQPPLSFKQLDYVGGMLEGAAMAVAMLEATASRDAEIGEVRRSGEPARRG